MPENVLISIKLCIRDFRYMNEEDLAGVCHEFQNFFLEI